MNKLAFVNAYKSKFKWIFHICIFEYSHFIDIGYCISMSNLEQENEPWSVESEVKIAKTQTGGNVPKVWTELRAQKGREEATALTVFGELSPSGSMLWKNSSLVFVNTQRKFFFLPAYCSAPQHVKFVLSPSGGAVSPTEMKAKSLSLQHCYPAPVNCFLDFQEHGVGPFQRGVLPTLFSPFVLDPIRFSLLSSCRSQLQPP